MILKNLKLNFKQSFFLAVVLLSFSNVDVFAQITPSSNGVVFVNKNVVGGNQSGSSWTNAVPEVADALLSAHNNSNIQQIWVAQGTYTPRYSAGSDNISPFLVFGTPYCGYFGSLVMVNNVKLYGGFLNANETSITQRDSINNNTILDGLDSFVHVVMSVGNVGSAELNGFTIKNGKATPYQTLYVNGQPTRSAYGGGVYMHNTNLRIYNCNITNNTANVGGGVYAENSSLTMKRTTLFNNSAIGSNGANTNSSSAAYGGGGFFQNGNFLTIDSCDISNNVATSIQMLAQGGGFGVSQNTPAQVNISNTTFNGNAVNLNVPSGVTPHFVNVFGGGFSIVNHNQVANINNCVFSDNTAQISSQNGTLSTTNANYVMGGGIFSAAPLLINNSIIKNNTVTASLNPSNNAKGMSSGGGIATDGARGFGGVGGVNTGVNLTINNTLIENNEVSGNFNPRGGGISYFMLMHLLPTAVKPKINNSIIRSNTAPLGGALFSFNMPPIIKNTLLQGNSATDGSVIYNDGEGQQSAHPQLINCTVVEHNTKSNLNSAPLFSNNYNSTTTIQNSIVYNNIGVFSNTTNIASYSNIEGSSVFPGVGNKNKNPKFVNASAGDYSLLNTSPAANAGNNALYTTVGNINNDTDLAGNTRLYENTIDMGAFELQTKSIIDTSTSISSLKDNNNKIKVYPNPIVKDGYVNIHFDYPLNYINGAKLTITNAVGKTLHTQVILGKEQQIKVPTLPGVYFITIKLLNGEQSTTSITVL